MNKSDIHPGTEYAYQENSYSSPRRVRLIEATTFKKDVTRGYSLRAQYATKPGWLVERLDAEGNVALRTVRTPAQYTTCDECKGRDLGDFTCQTCAGAGEDYYGTRRILIADETSEQVEDRFVAESRQLISTWGVYVAQARAKKEREYAKAKAVAAALPALNDALKALGLGGFASYDYSTGSITLRLGAETAEQLTTFLTTLA